MSGETLKKDERRVRKRSRTARKDDKAGFCMSIRKT